MSILGVVNCDKMMLDHLLNQGGSLHDARAEEIACQFADEAFGIEKIAEAATEQEMTRHDLAFAYKMALEIALHREEFLEQHGQPVSPLCAVITDTDVWPSYAVQLMVLTRVSGDVHQRRMGIEERAKDIAELVLSRADKVCRPSYAAKKVRNRSLPLGKGCAAIILFAAILSVAFTATAVAMVGN